MQPTAELLALKRLALLRLEESTRQQHGGILWQGVYPELPLVLEICLTGELPFVQVGVLLDSMRAADPTMSSEEASYIVATRVFTDPDGSSANRIADFVSFFNKPDRDLEDLQDRVLKFRARVLNLITNEIEDIRRPEFILGRSAWLAHCFELGQSMLIASVATVFLTIVKVRRPVVTRTLRNTERRRQIVNERMKQRSDFEDPEKLQVLCTRLDAEKIPLPVRRGAGRRPGTYRDAMKSMVKNKIMETLRRDLYRKRSKKDPARAN